MKNLDNYMMALPRVLRGLAGALAIVLVAQAAQAQVEPAETTPAETTPAEPVAEPSTPAATKETESEDVRLETSEDESIYILQERAYTKRGKLELTPAFFTSANPRFVNNTGAAVGLTIHLKEGLGLELMSSVYNDPKFTNLVFDINNYTGDNISLAPDLVDYKKMTYFGAASLQFSALYGKFETLRCVGRLRFLYLNWGWDCSNSRSGTQSGG